MDAHFRARTQISGIDKEFGKFLNNWDCLWR